MRPTFALFVAFLVLLSNGINAINITVFDAPERMKRSDVGTAEEYCATYFNPVPSPTIQRIVVELPPASSSLCHVSATAATKTSLIVKIACSKGGEAMEKVLATFFTLVSPEGNRPTIERQSDSDFYASSNSLTQSNAPWHLDRLDGKIKDGTYTYPGNGGKGITIFVIDTGVRITHEEFSPTGRASFDLDTISPGTGYTGDCHGHGTHVASLAAGVTYGSAKNATIKAIRALDCDGYGTLFSILTAIHAVQEHCDEDPDRPFVVVMSLSGTPMNSIESSLATLRTSCHALVVVAAGNQGANACDYSPARVSGLLAVGASRSDDTRASYSNTGPCVGIFAPGHLVTGASAFSPTYDSASDTNKVTMSGTSMATPIVAGVGALYLAAHINDPRGNENLGQSAKIVLRSTAEAVAALGDPFTTSKLLRVNISSLTVPPTPLPPPSTSPSPTPTTTTPPPPPSPSSPPPSELSPAPLPAPSPPTTPPPPSSPKPPDNIVVNPSPIPQMPRSLSAPISPFSIALTSAAVVIVVFVIEVDID